MKRPSGATSAMPADEFSASLLRRSSLARRASSAHFCSLKSKHESHPLVSTSFEHRAADQYGHAAAVLPEVLLLKRLGDSGRLQLCHSPFVPVPPFRRRQIRPAHTT